MMMANADEGSSVRTEGFFCAEDGSGDVLIDLDLLWGVDMEERPDPEQRILEKFPFGEDAFQGTQKSESYVSKLHEIASVSPSYNFETSDCGTGYGFSEPAGIFGVHKAVGLNPSSQLCFVGNICSTSITDCIPIQNNSHSNTYFATGSGNASSYFQQDDLHTRLMEEGTDSVSVMQVEDLCSVDRDRSSYGTSYTDSSSCEFSGADLPDISSANEDMYSLSSDDLSFLAQPKQDYLYRSVFKSLATDDDRMTHIMNEGANMAKDCLSFPTKDLMIGQCIRNYGSNCQVSLDNGVQQSEFNEMHSGNELEQPSLNTFLNMLGNVQDHTKFENIVGSVTSSDIVSRASEVVDEIISRNYYEGHPGASQDIRLSLYGNSPSIHHNSYVSCVKDEKQDVTFRAKKNTITIGSIGETLWKIPAARHWNHVLQVPEQPGTLLPSSVKTESSHLNVQNILPKFTGSYLSDTSFQRIQNSSFEQGNNDDDCDVCIIEDMNAPAGPIPVPLYAQPLVSSQISISKAPQNQMVSMHSRQKPNAERVIFHVALQDLSQPKSEAAPPDGVLNVPLLKHQRIALSWMINKETKSACCSGGILADDQGLGKTISTIALILKERSSSSKTSKINELNEAETLNLDDDNDYGSRMAVKGAESPLVNGCPINDAKTYLQRKGRPAAGTLIVCPTSVLRQWSDELHNRVTSEADLSVLVYHGSNRTKDPVELAKYDVVVTTYAIVSMEVPKQPVVDENDDKVGTPFTGFSSCKKRKLVETTSGKKSSRSKKSKAGIDYELFETLSGPLAKVGWFRVVLDEAQSIKNHRTQVARACWGLRSKRRWCLSGTPIQNAIDDLYSYFRFLRHEPYAVFKTFCEQLKTPIHKNPKDGYKKLQAVLKTIMLRRTKGTVIDGEPIINLPPKTIEMKKVDFSNEERDFYCRLEAESRAQFAEYAAAGTVKQNYVNILLMLLRLRQACDHPLLVKGLHSNSNMTSSIETAKKLPREKQIFLLNCLEASLAICGICNDPPEDSVVTVCGHVYCNQCICQHIIGDDTQCPIKNCKTHLTLCYIFSVTSLRISLSNQLNKENTPKSIDSVIEVNEPSSLSRPEDSSKIKAALELLLSLSKPHGGASRMSFTKSLEGSYCLDKLHTSDSVDEKRNTDVNSNSNNSTAAMGEKAIVFSQWTRMLDLLEACLKNSSIQYRRLDGTMPVVARDRAVKDFNSLPQVSVMIMSLKAASLGLNMVAACNVLLLDLWWNPTTEDQAIDRAHRIGQTRPVSVFRLTVKDTVEDRILALQQRKREMVASAFGEDETGPGCSSVGYGATQEIGPFLVDTNQGLKLNSFSWNTEANLLFLESPIGVGFSYSNTSDDYDRLGDDFTANDTYSFLHKWFLKFPSYRTQAFYIAGESYAGKYVPELAEIIHDKNKNPSSFIDLRGILLGNPETSDAEDWKGMVDYAWSHAVVSDETHKTIEKSCNFYSDNTWSNRDCAAAVEELLKQYKEIDIYSIYTSVCIGNTSRYERNSTIVSAWSSLKMMPRVMGGYDPCLDDYAKSFYNRAGVQKALHVSDGTNLRNWSICNMTVFDSWSDSKRSVLPVYKKLIAAGLRIWVYSGDTDGRVPVLSTRYSLSSLGLPIKKAWRPWYHHKQVGGWIQEYSGLTFATFRGAGHAVPVFKPSESLTLFSSFLSGEPLPAHR